MKLVVAAFLALTTATAAAQGTSLLAAPEMLWQASISPQGVGNECAYSPNAMLVCTSADGFVNAIDPANVDPAAAVPIWNYFPAPIGTRMSSSSGVSFSASDEFGSFLVYGITDLTDAGNVCRIQALSVASGVMLWSSPALVGACSGTPVIGFQGDYVYLTHSEDMSGTFSILKASDGTVFYEESDTTQPLSPPAIFHNPIRGSYAGGEGNRNDMIVWCNKPFPLEMGVLEGSTSYAFQFPIGFDGSSTNDVAVVTLLEDTGFQADARALITNFGTSLFWPVSRNALVAWPSTTFDKGPGGNRVSYSPRGNPASRPIIAEIAASRGSGVPTLFTGSASNHFGAIDIATVDGSEKIQEKWTITTDSPVYVRAQVAPDDTHVYTIEESGTVRQINVETGDVVWKEAVQGSVRGAGFAQTFNGDQIFFADTNGFVHAWKVGDAAPTTPAPVTVVMPTVAPAMVPVTAAPVVVGTPEPIAGNVTMAPVTVAPVVPGTDAPVMPVTTVLDVILEMEPPLTTLTALVVAINGTAILIDPELKSTVFAPYDEAFAADFTEDYLSDYITDLSEKPEWVNHATCYLENHLGEDLTSTTDMWKEGQQVTTGGSKVVLLGTTPVASVDDIPIANANNIASNGVVQFLADGTILSECVSVNILQAGQNNVQFSTLLSLVTKAGIAAALATQRPLTLFAPTNAAFEALDPDVLAYLTDDANIAEMREVLFYHLVRSNLYLEDATDTGEFVSTNSELINITMVADDWFVNEIKIVDDNILFQNGIIQAIDEVLVPPSFALPTMIPITTSPVTVAPATEGPDVPTEPELPTTVIPVGGGTATPVTVAPVTVAPVTIAPVTVTPDVDSPSNIPSDSPSAKPVNLGTPAPIISTPQPSSRPSSAPTTAPTTSSAAANGMLGLVVAMIVGFCL